MNKNSQPLVSVLMTVYNRVQYISEAIESVMASTYQNWELIIVDDQSNDGSLKVAQSYVSKDERIRLYVNEKNLGDYPNRNKAASYAKGKYLKYLDADDLIYKHSLRVFVDTMEQFPDAAAGIGYNKIDDKEPYPQYVKPEEAYKKFFFDHNIFGTGPSASIIRTDAFFEVGQFNAIRHEGDMDLWLRMSAVYPVIKLQPALIWWRVHPGQEHQKRKNNNLNFYTSIRALEAPNCPMNKEDIKRATWLIKRRSIRNILNMGVKKGFVSLAYNEFVKSKHSIYNLFKALK